MKTRTLICLALSVATLGSIDLSNLFSFSSYPGNGATVSVSQLESGDTVTGGEHHIVGGTNSIDGFIDLTVPFEVVPGEEVTLDVKLWNVDETVASSVVMIRMDMPNGMRRELMTEQFTLDSEEIVTFHLSDVIPEDFQLYGRYTIKLFIDDRLSDFFQFDLHGRDGIEVRWDDGVMANAWAFYDLCNAWAIRGCLPQGAVLDSIGTYILSENDDSWPWPDDIHQDILLQVYDDDGSRGMPGTLLYSEVSSVTPGTSHAVAFPAIALSNGFYITNDQLTDYPACEAQCVDRELNHPDQMFTRIDGIWGNAGTEYGGDFMMWGVGHMGSDRIVIGTPPVR